jgi:hypothetical protein
MMMMMAVPALPEPPSCEDSEFDASACSASKACSICWPNCGVVADVAAPELDVDDPDGDDALDEAELAPLS